MICRRRTHYIIVTPRILRSMHKFICQQGDIFLVNFGDISVGHEIQRLRPAIVVQSDEQLQKSNLVTIIPLSSKIQDKMTDEIIVKSDSGNLLRVDSVIKVFDIITRDPERFLHKIGEVDAETMQKVKEYLKKHFGI